MPTPFQHLVYARNFLADQALPEALRTVFQAEAGAFLLGATAVDVQVLTSQARAETHFYEVPPREEARAVPTLLAACPTLAASTTSPRGFSTPSTFSPRPERTMMTMRRC